MMEKVYARTKGIRDDMVVGFCPGCMHSTLFKLIGEVLGLDASSVEIVNRPPTRSKPIYMKVWEARKADGLDYDPEDERQQAFLSEITKYNIRSIE